MERSISVLHVEDDANAGQAMMHALHLAKPSWRFLVATSGEMALRLIPAWNVDVVIADIGLGGMSGTELLRRIAEAHPRILRVVLSGRIDTEALLETDKWAQLAMCKPCNTEPFIKRIADEMRLRDHLLRERDHLRGRTLDPRRGADA